jgi:predicted DNA-binding protein YlxM (UPF0122 family)
MKTTSGKIMFCLFDQIGITKILSESFGCLTENELYVLSHYYGINKERANFSEIARKLNLSRSRIGGIHKTAIQKLFPAIRKRIITDFYGEFIGRQEFFKLRKIKGCDMEQTLILPLEQLELTVRSYNCLRNAHIWTVGDLIKKTERQLLEIPNFGRKGLNEVKDQLKMINLKLKGV